MTAFPFYQSYEQRGLLHWRLESNLINNQNDFEIRSVVLDPCPTWQVHRQTDKGFVPVRWTVAGVGEETHPVRLGTVGGPHFSTIDDIFVPFPHCLGLNT